MTRAAQLGEAVALFAEVREPGNPGRRNALAQLAQLAAARGSEAECRASLRAAAEISGWSFPFAGFSGFAALGLLALGQGQDELAVTEFERVLLPRMRAFLLSHEVADAIEAYARCGRRTDARHLLEPFAMQAQASGWPWAQARTAHLGGAAHRRPFDEPFAAALAFHSKRSSRSRAPAASSPMQNACAAQAAGVRHGSGRTRRSQSSSS